MQVLVPDWRGRTLKAARSKGGVISFIDYDAQLMRPHPGSTVWPPACIVQKLYASTQGGAFHPQDLDQLKQRLGHYTDLQSANSEDVMTWNYFGLLSTTSSAEQARFSNWLIRQLGASWEQNSECTITLWRRIPHPDTNGQDGPELDALIQGDKFVIIVEAKWTSPEDLSQGKPIEGQKNKGQFQLRQEFLEKLGEKIFGVRQLGLLAVSLKGGLIAQNPSGAIPRWETTWERLCQYCCHPAHPEIETFYRWKLSLCNRVGSAK